MGVGSNGAIQFWTAAQVPGWENEFQPSRALSEDGRRLFFESYDALVPGDTNGAVDVYEWEATGEDPSNGKCTEASPSYSPPNSGCLSLITSGTSPEETAFIDASADGSNVFFLTQSSLLPADPGLRDLYDARVDGGFPEPEPIPPLCEGEACQNAPGAPNDPTPGSLSFQGAGNVNESPPAHCPKGKVRRKGRCVAKRHKRAHERHTGPSPTDGRR